MTVRTQRTAFGIGNRNTCIVLILSFFVCAVRLTAAPDTALKTAGGIMQKVWVIKDNVPLYKDTTRSSSLGVLPQNAKAYCYGPAGSDLTAVGSHPLKEDCDPGKGGFFGYVPTDATLMWDTDQALRFTGTSAEIAVAVYADPEMTDQVGEFAVRPTDDPTVEPFPIFARSQDGKAFEIACVIGRNTPNADMRHQRMLNMDPNSLSAAASIDIAFVMDVTGSMTEELEGVKDKVASFIREFSQIKVEIQGRKEPLRLRFAFIGYRDVDDDESNWLDIIDFKHIGQQDDLHAALNQYQAEGGCGDFASVFSAIQKALDDLAWNSANARTIILIGDMPGKNLDIKDQVLKECHKQFVPVYTLSVGQHPPTLEQFKYIARKTGGFTMPIKSTSSSSETVQRIVDAINEMARQTQRNINDVEEYVRADNPGTKMTAQLSRTIQEFKMRGIMPKWGEKPLPPTVFVPSMENENIEVCLYKSKAKLHDMLGGMQMDFISMASDASPETLLALQSGGLEMIAELTPGALSAIVNLQDLGQAPAKIQELLNAMPDLPDLLRKLSETNPADVAAWKELAEKTASLSRFVANPANFFNNHAWVPFSVMRVE